MTVRPLGTAALLACALLSSLPFASMSAQAVAGKPVSDRDKVSYIVGADVGRSILRVGPDIDLAAFERAITNAFGGHAPLIDEAESQTVGTALMQRIAQRAAGPTPDTPAAPTPGIAKDKVGFLVGADVGRSLTPIKDELNLVVFMQAVRTRIAGGELLLTETEATEVRDAFSRRLQAEDEARARVESSRNVEEGNAFLAKNAVRKGVVTTASGLQYEILRPGSGPSPVLSNNVSVNYSGALLNGTVFDSSYERGRPADFGLGQVIPGWTEGLALMSVGAKFRFWIPSALAYGDRGAPPTIGPGATLVFDVELLGIR